MNKPELGAKRLCAGCAARFYDLGRDPIVCPTCQSVFVVPVPPPSRPPRFPRAFQAFHAAPIEAEAETEEKDEEDADATSDVLLLDDEEDNGDPKPEEIVTIDSDKYVPET